MRYKHVMDRIGFDIKFAIVLLAMIAFNILTMIIFAYLGLYQKII